MAAAAEFGDESLRQRIAQALAGLEAPCSCGGSLDFSRVSICCSAGSSPLLFQFPTDDLQQLRELEALCAPATFGKGTQEVLDPSYRRALALSTDKFFTNFDIHLPSILSTVKTVMVPEATSISAERYKLNIYRAGDFFKVHQDTPRGDGMFGSLVVCLPQPHKGGALLVRHQGQEQTFNWSVGGTNAEPLTVQWAAFFSDCKHEILPVESGHRVTLTYNLYKIDDKQGPHLPGLSTQGMQLHAALAAAVSSDSVLPDGGLLGYPCTHTYPHSDHSLIDKVPSMLKGTDAVCFSVMQQMGLQPKVQAVWDISDDLEYARSQGIYPYGSQGDNGEDEEESTEDDGLRVTCLQGMDAWYGEEEMLRNMPPKGEDVWWMTRDFNYQGQARNTEYTGNDGCEYWYSAVAVLADVPAWGSKEREQLVKELTP